MPTDTRNNRPITLAQLRAMDGEVVWLCGPDSIEPGIVALKPDGTAAIATRHSVLSGFALDEETIMDSCAVVLAERPADYPSKTIKQDRLMSKIQMGVHPDAPMVTNDQGGRQSATPFAFHLLPVNALFAAAEVVKQGADKYDEKDGERNYLKIPVKDHINHCIQHMMAHLANDTSDAHLSHALVRSMFAYEVAWKEEAECRNLNP